jgi:predicted DNA-binding transcriptional regulator AlpA
MGLPRHITQGVIAQKLGISRQRVHQLEQQGKLPPPVAILAVNQTGFDWHVWDEAEIDRWMADRNSWANAHNRAREIMRAAE